MYTCSFHSAPCTCFLDAARCVRREAARREIGRLRGSAATAAPSAVRSADFLSSVGLRGRTWGKTPKSLPLAPATHLRGTSLWKSSIFSLVSFSLLRRRGVWLSCAKRKTVRSKRFFSSKRWPIFDCLVRRSGSIDGADRSSQPRSCIGVGSAAATSSREFLDVCLLNAALQHLDGTQRSFCVHNDMLWDSSCRSMPQQSSCMKNHRHICLRSSDLVLAQAAQKNQCLSSAGGDAPGAAHRASAPRRCFARFRPAAGESAAKIFLTRS